MPCTSLHCQEESLHYMRSLKLELELGAKMIVILCHWHRKQTTAMHSYKPTEIWNAFTQSPLMQHST